MTHANPNQEQPTTSVTGRFGKHLRALAESGNDAKEMAQALANIRDDRLLTAIQRDALLRMIAQDAALAYIEIATGERFSPPPPSPAAK